LSTLPKPGLSLTTPLFVRSLVYPSSILFTVLRPACA
jgi:hypothetical protein